MQADSGTWPCKFPYFHVMGCGDTGSSMIVIDGRPSRARFGWSCRRNGHAESSACLSTPPAACPPGCSDQPAPFPARHSRASSSAIWTAFSAAPFRRLSDTHQRFRPLSIVLSRRIRLTYVSSRPAASIGVA